jgi:hypothetical protein
MDTKELRKWTEAELKKAEWQHEHGFFSDRDALRVEAFTDYLAILDRLDGLDKPDGNGILTKETK